MSGKYSEAAIEAGWTEEDIEQFLEWKDQFVEAINDGVYDEHLKEIARACFDRKHTMEGKPTVAAQQAALMTPAGIRVLGEGGALLRPVSVVARTYAVDGPSGIKWYSKDDMVGKHFRLKAKNAFYLNDVLVKIISVGNKNISVEFIDDPRKMYPTSTKARELAPGQQASVTLPMFHHIFDY